MPIDYKAWDHIDVSDDEDDLLRHVDKESLFKFRHQARLEKMADAKREKSETKENSEKCRAKISEIELKLEQDDLDEVQKQDLQSELNENQKQLNENQRKLEGLLRKSLPWNVDTIAKDSFSKSRINSINVTQLKEDDDSEIHFKRFTNSNKTLISQFGMLSKCKDSKQFLLENRHLCCEETANILVLECLNYEMEGKHNLMEHVARQTIMFQYLLELAKELCVKPHSQNIISSFYDNFHKAGKTYLDIFEQELDDFKHRILARVTVKLADMKEKERQNRLGPGGLDPEEVFESLPEEIQKCFTTRNVSMLQEVAATMDVEVFEYHLKRCIDSGLWVPNSKKNEQESENAFEEK